MSSFEKEKGKGQQPTGTKPYEEKYYRGFKKIIARKKRRKTQIFPQNFTDIAW